MSQKATKEQMPAMIAEVVNRTNNIESLMVIQKYLFEVSISGAQAMELGRAIAWVKGVLDGEHARVKELKAQLPDQDTEIKMGPEEPEKPEEGADTSQPAVSQGGVELQKGEPVLGAV